MNIFLVIICVFVSIVPSFVETHKNIDKILYIDSEESKVEQSTSPSEKDLTAELQDEILDDESADAEAEELLRRIKGE